MKKCLMALVMACAVLSFAVSTKADGGHILIGGFVAPAASPTPIPQDEKDDGHILIGGRVAEPKDDYLSFKNFLAYFGW